MRSTLIDAGPEISRIAADFPSSGHAGQAVRLRILGCSGGIGRNLRTSSILLNHHVLIDMGTGVGELGLDELNQVDTLFLTHSHLDHTAMLPMFLDTTFEHRVHKPLTVYALAETINALRTHMFNDVLWPDFELLPNVANPVLSFISLDGGETVDIDDFRVHAVDVNHAVPSLGFCVESKRQVFGFSGGTITNESLWQRLNHFDSLDALVVEVGFPNGSEALARTAGLYTPTMLADDLKKLRHSPRVWVSAMKPGFEEQIMDELLVALPQADVRCLRRGDEFVL